MANERKIISLLMVFTCLETTLVETQTAKSENNNEFANIQSQSLIIDDSVSLNVVDGLLTDQPSALISHLVFQPKLLDFLQRPIGSVNSSQITLINRHDNQSVSLGSITSTGSSSDFYSSYFEEKVIPPQGNSTFQIVFLPRQIGQMSGLFQIHTSFGMLRYTVKGEGTECLYRLQPLVGLKAPLNATISPEILMYNPHDTPLQINEIYSSGGNFQLELPSGGQEGPQVLWEIPPHSTKPIIRVRFTGRVPGNHTAYVRIKLSSNSTHLKDKILIVPIEIEIMNHTGIYSKIPFIDLGVVGSTNQTFKYNFNLINSGNRFVDIKNWQIESGDTSLIDSITLNLQRFTRNENIADRLSMEIDWRRVQTSVKFLYGTIVVNATVFDDNYGGEQKQFPYVYKIPFAGQIVKGQIDYNRKNVSFFVGDGHQQLKQLPLVREFMLRNQFGVPLAVTEVTVPEGFTQHFTIAGFEAVVLLPGDMKTLFKISLREGLPGESLPPPPLGRLTTEYAVTLTTNVSVYEIPIIRYASLLRRVVPFDAFGDNPGDGLDEREINFGILPVSTFGEMLVAFINDNPIPIAVREWEGTFNGAASISTIPRGCGRADTDSYKLTSKSEYMMLCDEIKPGEMFVFQVSVLSDNVGAYNGRLSVKTDYEELVTPIKFTTAMGRLEVLQDQLQFKDCFPGKVCSLNLHAYSTFMKTMTVEGVTVDNGSVTYEYADENEGGDDELPEIAPNQLTNIGRLSFDPRQQCQLNCYSSFDLLSKPFGVKWMSTLDNYTLYNRLDSEKLMAQLQLFNATREFVKNVSFRLTTTQVRRLEYNATINYVWPKLLTESIIQFPVIQVEQEAVKFITLHNPSDHLLFVHYILHDPLLHGTVSWLDQFADGAASKASLIQAANIMHPCENCSLSNQPSMFGFLFDEGEIYVNYVKPKSFVKIGLKFTATEPGAYSTILYMRNNLTTMDAIWITGKAAVPQFKFGNRKPGSPTALLFEIVDKHTKVCEQPVTQAISTKRTFTARNYGEVPILISGILIDDALCEGYGFKILDCSPFELAPNASKKIEISFAPDFTLARVTHTLYFDTDIGPLPTSINFSLVGTIPPHSLEPCIAAVVRPAWEAKLKNVAVGVLTLVFVLVIIVAYFDSDRILKEHYMNMSKDKGPIQPALDLRQIGLQQSSGSPVAVPATPNTADPKKSVDSATKQQNGGSGQTFSTKSRKIGKKLPYNGTNAVNNSSPTAASTPSGGPTSSVIKTSWAEFTNKLTRTKTPPAADASPPPSSSASKSTQSTNKPQTNRDKQPTTMVATSSSPPSSHQTNSAVKGGGSGGGGGRNQKPKEKIIEEDTMSTSTESSSSNSSEDLVSEKSTKIDKLEQSGGKKGPPAKLNLSLDEQQTLKTHVANSANTKVNVKKTKSLPLSGFEAGPAKESPVNGLPKTEKPSGVSLSKTTPKASNGPLNGQHNGGNENVQDNKQNEAKPPKKYGKTPGRERKPSSNQSNKNTNSSFKGTAFSFSSPVSKTNGNDHSSLAATGGFLPTLTLPPPNSTNIWSNDKVSFSDIVAKNTLNDLPPITSTSSSSGMSLGKNVRSTLFDNNNMSAQPNKAASVRRLLMDGPGMLKNNSNNSHHDRDFLDDLNQTSTHLGPIGSRKSPSAMQSWDAMMAKPVPISQSHAYNNSFYSYNFPQQNVNWNDQGYMNYMPQSGGGQQRNDLMDNSSNGNLWQSGQYHQSSSQGNCQPQPHMSKLSMWSQNAAVALQQQQQQQQHQMNWSNNNNNNINSYTIRPPPGFHYSSEHQQDLHHRTVAGHYNGQEESNSQQQHQQHQSSNSAYDSQVSSYDPFRSLDSIWPTERWGRPLSDDKKQQ